MPKVSNAAKRDMDRYVYQQEERERKMVRRRNNLIFFLIGFIGSMLMFHTIVSLVLGRIW